ncbi:hypothetical protein QVD17_20971 [Tagetes erecta]|uniref:Uncharacterized protein n=1 Tax=Tagetes erecta TaxID=13708 RepID=A0AAD8KMI2_TARER|nr:hypothetical protein QVD17_20971 [Tagetes erecta]
MVMTGKSPDFPRKVPSIGVVEKKLKEMVISYKKQRVDEGEIYIDQLFFHDLDGFMIEICNCDVLPVIPIAGDMVRSCSRFRVPGAEPPTRVNLGTTNAIDRSGSSFPAEHQRHHGGIGANNDEGWNTYKGKHTRKSESRFDNRSILYGVGVGG